MQGETERDRERALGAGCIGSGGEAGQGGMGLPNPIDPAADLGSWGVVESSLSLRDLLGPTAWGAAQGCNRT